MTVNDDRLEFSLDNFTYGKPLIVLDMVVQEK